ncbi:MAG: heat-inducible transcriptional repressor HrcA [Bacilli bacterium]|nr:heat-inducible transcriptional repressor HrcA [Bacilli bacterium]
MNRRDKVLKLIVEHFIKSAQPVGSKTLIEEYGLEYSSATIRSEMNALEVDGYLEKTHISSGRVPSSKGYRYYIANLRDRSIDEEFKYQMQTVLDQKVKSIQDVIKQSCEILSQMTNLASIVLGPGANNEHLVSVQLVPISDTSATCVFVTDQGYVENKTFVIDEKNKLNDVENCVKLLNDRLKGTSISELIPKMQAIRPLINDMVINHDVIYKAMLEAFVGFAKDRLSAFGQEELFEQPEFANDANKMKKLMELLNRPDVFREVENDNENISIHIGGEALGDEDVSIVQAKVKMPGKQERSIAVVGPKRMDYDKVVSSLEYLINQLDSYYEDERKEDKRERENKQRNQKGGQNQRTNREIKR